MKRAAAILGPTPSFVRWVIHQDCPFRQNDFDDLPYQIFRQLRGLREVSLCRLENRIIDGLSIHADMNKSAETARGFLVNEVLEFFDNEQEVQKTCGPCPANAQSIHLHSDSQEKIWAGCYGWFFSQTDNQNLIDCFDSVVSQCSSPMLGHFLPSTRLWFRVWQTTLWESVQLESLKHVINLITAQHHTMDTDFSIFAAAVNTCYKNQLVLQTELVPIGHSDGIHWKIEPHCSNCHVELNDSSRQCKECGATESQHGAIKRKVLGLRPYMLLKDLLGKQKTQDLLQKFHEANNANDIDRAI